MRYELKTKWMLLLPGVIGRVECSRSPGLIIAARINLNLAPLKIGFMWIDGSDPWVKGSHALNVYWSCAWTHNHCWSHARTPTRGNAPDPHVIIPPQIFVPNSTGYIETMRMLSIHIEDILLCYLFISHPQQEGEHKRTNWEQIENIREHILYKYFIIGVSSLLLSSLLPLWRGRRTRLLIAILH